MVNEKNIGITASKDNNFSEWYTQVCSPQGAGLADVRYGVQGFIVHLPWSFKILRRIYEYLEEELEADGHEPFLFPTVIKKENLEKEKEHAGFAPEVFWVNQAGSETLAEPVALRPTGETQIYPMYSLWIRSHAQLPYKGYQSRITVFRNEMTTRPFLRGREFMFFETHNVYACREDALKQVKTDGEIMNRVYWDKLKIPHFFFIRPQWDKFLGADNTFVADTLMPDGKRTQLSSTHDLGQNFSKAYDVKFVDKDEKEKFAFQTCFGPGIWRIMASLISIHGDDKGLILPFDVAPYQVVIVPVLFSDESENARILEKCKEYKALLSSHFRVFLDDSDNTPGWKFNEWEMKGVPIRVEVGPKDLAKGSVAITRRTSKRVFVPADDVVSAIKSEATKLDEDVEVKAKAYFEGHTRSTDEYEELKSLLNTHRGFVSVPFCSIDFDGEKCADKIKEDTAGNVCGIPWSESERLSSDGKNCVVCGKSAKHIVFVAKSY